jgi:hypothetical protein
MLLKAKPVPTFLLVMGLLVGLIFPPLLVAYVLFALVWIVRKVRAHTDPQAVAWRKAEDWYRQNG